MPPPVACLDGSGVQARVWPWTFGISRTQSDSIGRGLVWGRPAALPRRARMSGSWTFVALNSGIEINEDEEEEDLPSLRSMS